MPEGAHTDACFVTMQIKQFFKKANRLSLCTKCGRMGVLINLIISFFSVLPFWRSDRVHKNYPKKQAIKSGHFNGALSWLSANLIQPTKL
jgi:hypothetical protein